MAATCRKAFNRWVLLRSFSEVFAILSFILALAKMPIADVTAIAQTAPLIVLIGTWLIWGDKIGTLRFLLIGLGITGAILVAQPGGSCCFAVCHFRLLVRRRCGWPRYRHPQGAGRNAGAGCHLLDAAHRHALRHSCVSLLFETPVAPTLRHAGLMAVAGIFLMCGHALHLPCLSHGAGAGGGAVQLFLHAVGGLSGLLLFSEVPNALAIAGMALILLAGLARGHAGGPDTAR